MEEKEVNYTTLSRHRGNLNRGRIFLLVICGLAVGFVTGLFGGGGGMLLVPLLTNIGMLGEKEAHASSIAVILPVAITSMSVYLASGVRAEPRLSAIIVLGVLIGGLFGTFLLKKLNAKALKILFYLVMIVAGVKMLLPH